MYSYLWDVLSFYCVINSRNSGMHVMNLAPKLSVYASAEVEKRDSMQNQCLIFFQSCFVNTGY